MIGSIQNSTNEDVVVAAADSRRADSRRRSRRRSSLGDFASFVVTPTRDRRSARGRAALLVHCFTILGCGVALSGVGAVALVALSRIEWTTTDNKGVPVLEHRAMLWTVMVPCAVVFSIACAANVAQLTSSTSGGPIKALWTVVVGVLLGVVACVITRALIDAYDVRYYAAELFVLVVLAILVIMSDEIGRQAWRARNGARRAMIHQNEGGEHQSSVTAAARNPDVAASLSPQTRVVKTFVALIPIIAAITLAFAYPLYFMPRASARARVRTTAAASANSP